MQPEPDNWHPPFCPNPKCDFHANSKGWRYKKTGFHERCTPPHKVQRYRCSCCNRSFSTQTFSVTYWLKQPGLLGTVFEGLLTCTAYRQMARFRGVSPSTIMGQAERLGRHALLALEFLRPKTAPAEAVVVDGFESFEFSQFFPLHVNVAVGADSHFIYGFTDAELRRKGRKTEAQKSRQAQLEKELGRPDPKAIENAMRDLVGLFAAPGSQVVIHSDEHKAYPRAFRRVDGVEIEHRTTSSKKARTTANPLFPVNRLDLWARHNGANHKRETIAFSKRRQSVMERFAVLALWLNCMKSFSEKRKDAPPGQKLGLIQQKLTLDDLLARRLFPSQIRLPECWQRYYDRAVETRCIPNGKRHELSYAY
jgi:transposase-like protein